MKQAAIFLLIATCTICAIAQSNYFTGLRRSNPQLYILFASLISNSRTDDTADPTVAEEARYRLFANYFRQTTRPEDNDFPAADSLHKVIIKQVTDLASVEREFEYIVTLELYYWQWASRYFLAKFVTTLQDTKSIKLAQAMHSDFIEFIQAQRRTARSLPLVNPLLVEIQSYRVQAWILDMLAKSVNHPVDFYIPQLSPDVDSVMVDRKYLEKIKLSGGDMKLDLIREHELWNAYCNSNRKLLNSLPEFSQDVLNDLNELRMGFELKNQSLQLLP